VKVINWNPKKNEWLKKKRGVCFEQVATILEQKNELDVIDHPNSGHRGRHPLPDVDFEHHPQIRQRSSN